MGESSMKQSILKWISTGLLSLTLGLGAGWVLYKKESSPPAAPAKPAVALPEQGYHMPSISLTVYPGDKAIRTADLVGKPVFLNFFASWCPPCKQEMPEIVKAYQQYGSKVVFLSVNATVDDSLPDVRNFINDYGIAWPVALDKKGNVMNAYRIVGFPTSFFINRDGVVTYTHSGFLPRQTLLANLEKIAQ